MSYFPFSDPKCITNLLSWFWKKKNKKKQNERHASDAGVDPDFSALKGAIQKKQSIASVRSRDSLSRQDDINSSHNWRKTSIDKNSSYEVSYHRPTIADISLELLIKPQGIKPKDIKPKVKRTSLQEDKPPQIPGRKVSRQQTERINRYSASGN